MCWDASPGEFPRLLVCHHAPLKSRLPNHLHHRHSLPVLHAATNRENLRHSAGEQSNKSRRHPHSRKSVVQIKNRCGKRHRKNRNLRDLSAHVNPILFTRTSHLILAQADQKATPMK